MDILITADRVKENQEGIILALKILFDAELWPIVKFEAIEYVVANWGWFKDQTDFESYLEYKSFMSADCEHGTYTEATAISEKYHRTVIIIENGYEYATITWPGDKDPVVLRYNRIGPPYDLYESLPAGFGVRLDENKNVSLSLNKKNELKYVNREKRMINMFLHISHYILNRRMINDQR